MNGVAETVASGGLLLASLIAFAAGVLSFVIDGLHPQDLGVLLDSQGVAIRTGHHCAMPVLSRYGLSGTARASFAFYNTHEDVDRFYAALAKACQILA